MGRKMRQNIGILAAVDSGKTTLAEAILYQSGAVKKMGRVDNQDAFLDHFALERARGITIFSKQAIFHWKDWEINLLDTPGHIDFSAEMERTLTVLDYAILVISGASGVQGHTKTLWKLLRRYHIPTFIFVNKLDQNGVEKENVYAELGADHVMVSYESLVHRNPDIILIANMEGVGYEEKKRILKEHPALQNLPAVKNDYIYPMSLGDISPGVRNVDFIIKLNKLLYGRKD